MDTAKCAAGHLNKPIFAFPTLASNCASCTTLCVMYYPDGAMRDLYYPKRCAIHTFMDSEIIANSPAEYVWAGIGDSLAKEFESEFAARNDLAAFKIQHAPLMGTGHCQVLHQRVPALWREGHGADPQPCGTAMSSSR